jgi:hypothetical protein
MQTNSVLEQMAAQIHHVKPDHLVPGQTIGMRVKDERTLIVEVPCMRLQATVEYLPGPDLYSVERLLDDEVQSWSEVYCDQLGELIFGDAASEWTAPLVEVYVPDPNEPDTFVRVDAV